MDELFGSLSAYEMRTMSTELSKREVAFTFEKKGKEVASCAYDDELEATKANF